MSVHELTSSPLYVLNGLVMTINFFIFRIVFQYKIIFTYMRYFMIYRADEFWNLYPQEYHNYMKFGLCAYCALYALNIYWFTKMIAGLLKAIGVEDYLERKFGSKSVAPSDLSKVKTN